MAGSRSLGSLHLDLIARVGGFTGPLDKAGRVADSRLRAIEKRATQFGAAFGVALTAAAGSVAYGLKSAIDRMDEMSKSAQKVGVTTEALSRLAHAAELSDVPLEQLQSGLAKMTKLQADAAQGGKEAARTFASFGIAIKDSNGHLRGTEQVLQDFARVFQALPDGPEKTALALRAFGKSGAELIPLLNSGADGLKRFADEADRMGLTIGSKAGRDAEEFNDNLTRLQGSLQGLANKIVTPVLPELGKLSDALQGLSQSQGASFADAMAADLETLSKSARHVAVEIEYLRKLWKEQGLFGEGIFATLRKAQAEFDRREALMDGLAIHGGPRGRGTARKGAAEGKLEFGASEAAKRLLATEQPSGGGSARKQRTEVDQLAEAIARMNSQMAEQIALFGKTTEVAKLRYELENGELAKAAPAEKEKLLRQAAILDRLKEEAEQTERLNQLQKEREETIKRAHDALAATFSDREFDLKLYTLTNAQRQVEIELRRIGIGLTEQETADARARLLAMEEQREGLERQVRAMDNMRQSFEDIFSEVASGQMSLIDGLKAFADAFVAQLIRMAAAQASIALFGEPGTTGGGSIGGFLAKFFKGSSSSSSGDLFDFGLDLAGFASGTDYAPGGWAVVGEEGPELVNLPRGAQVVPASESRRMSGGFTQVINNTYRAPVDARTQDQVAKEMAYRGRMAMLR